jgi:hypothetical protein
MNEKKQKKTMPVSLESDDDEKQIRQAVPKKGGRPRKARAAAL